MDVATEQQEAVYKVPPCLALAPPFAIKTVYCLPVLDSAGVCFFPFGVVVSKGFAQFCTEGGTPEYFPLPQTEFPYVILSL